jgi:uncharacterized protein
MYLHKNTVHFSASDVSSHVGCAHLTLLKLMVAKGELTKPFFDRPHWMFRIERREFERSFLEELRKEGKTIVEIDRDDSLNAEQQHFEAMRSGADYIYRPGLNTGSGMGGQISGKGSS